MVDRFSMRLHVFDGHGRHIESAAGKGEGPGELMNVYGMVSAGGESIAIWDSALRRLSVFSSHTRFVRSEQLDVDAELGNRLVGRLADGRFVALLQEMPGTGPDGGAPIGQKRRLRMGGGADATTLELPSAQVVVEQVKDGFSVSPAVHSARSVAVHPFAADAQLRLAFRYEQDSVEPVVLLYRLPAVRVPRDASPSLGRCNSAVPF